MKDRCRWTRLDELTGKAGGKFFWRGKHNPGPTVPVVRRVYQAQYLSSNQVLKNMGLIDGKPTPYEELAPVVKEIDISGHYVHDKNGFPKFVPDEKSKSIVISLKRKPTPYVLVQMPVTVFQGAARNGSEKL